MPILHVATHRNYPLKKFMEQQPSPEFLVTTKPSLDYETKTYFMTDLAWKRKSTDQQKMHKYPQYYNDNSASQTDEPPNPQKIKLKT